MSETAALPGAIHDLRVPTRHGLPTLRQPQGNISKAAEEIGMYRQHLQLKLTEYEIDATQYRPRPER